MARGRKKRLTAAELKAFNERRYLIGRDYPMKKAGHKGEEFLAQFPTSRHYLYWKSLFWFHHDLILETDQMRQCINFDKHYRLCKFLERIEESCTFKHENMGNPKKLKLHDTPDDYFLEMSRATFKTKYAMSFIIWVILKHPNWTNMYARSTARDSSKVILTLGEYLKKPSILHQYFPQLFIKPTQIKKRGGRINKTEIKLPYAERPETNDPLVEGEEIAYGIEMYEDGDGPVNALNNRISKVNRSDHQIQVECNINGWGLNETYTGGHINGITIVDDSVTEKNYQSEIEQDKILGHFAELSSICMSQSVRLYVGTPYSDEDALQKTKRTYVVLQKEEDRLGTGKKVAEYFWQPLLELNRADGTPYNSLELLQYVVSPKNEYEAKLGEAAIVFPESVPPQEIRRKYIQAKETGKLKFFISQYLLTIVNDEDKPFKEDWLVYYGPGTAIPDPPMRSELEMAGLIDPSGGHGSKNDNVGIMIYGLDKHGYAWIFEAIEKRLSSIQLMQYVYGLNSIYGPMSWHMESVAMANQYRGLMNMLLSSGKIPVEEDGKLVDKPFNLTIQELKPVGGTSLDAKARRIRGATWLFETRRIRIQPEHTILKKRILEWPAYGKPDELMDLLGYLKERVYPTNTNESKGIGGRFQSKAGFTPQDLIRMEMEHIRHERLLESVGEMTHCMKCGADNPVTNFECCRCGLQSLYRGPSMEPVMEDYMWN